MGHEQKFRDYLKALEDRAPLEVVTGFQAANYQFVELPSRIAPNGRSRSGAALQGAYGQGLQLLSSQRYEVKNVVEAGDELAAEVEWTGTLAVPFQEMQVGTRLKAYVAMFVSYRDGLIVSQRNYDCYPPFGTEFTPSATPASVGSA